MDDYTRYYVMELQTIRRNVAASKQEQNLNRLYQHLNDLIETIITYHQDK